MTVLFDPILSLAQFKLPVQDISVLSFCQSNKLTKVKAWLDELKLTQVKATSIEVYEALPQISHLNVDVHTRFAMLEAFWPVTQQCIQGLLKDFLQQPLILPDSALKTALLAQALQRHLLDGYTLCIRELSQRQNLKVSHRELLLNAIFRALNALGWLMLRAYQLYTAVPPGMWIRAHTLFQVAEYYDLHDEAAFVAGGSVLQTPLNAYVQLLALASIRPNQLSQNDIYLAFKAFESWAKYVHLLPSATADENNPILVELTEDRGPVTKLRFAGDVEKRVIELDFQNLLQQLSRGALSKSRSDWADSSHTQGVSNEMPSSLLDHIHVCWRGPGLRELERNAMDTEIDICVGIMDCHFHLCGNTEFEQFINPRILKNNDDGFLSGGFDSLINSMSASASKDESSAKAQRITQYRVVLQNVSAGGYCVFWNGDMPTSRVEAGEIMGIREPGRRGWSLGIVRWIRQLKGGSQLGIQLLSSQPVPYGAATLFDMGGYSDYMRAVHISAPSIPNQPPSLLTSLIPFQENTRVRLKQEDQVVDVRLNKCIFSTSKIRLFTFEVLNADGEKRAL